MTSFLLRPKAGVGVMIDKELNEALIEVVSVSERIILVKLE